MTEEATNTKMKTGEMAQKSRALVALAEDVGLVSSTHMEAHNRQL